MQKQGGKIREGGWNREEGGTGMKKQGGKITEGGWDREGGRNREGGRI